MKILIVSPRFPWPLDAGDKIRIYYTLRELARYHEVTLVSLVEHNELSSCPGPIEKLCTDIQIVPFKISRKLAALRSVLSRQPYGVYRFPTKILKTVLYDKGQNSKYDIVWVHFLHTFADLDLKPFRRSIIVLDQHNADELWWSQYAAKGSLIVKAFALQNLWKVKDLQKRILDQIDILLSVSDKEAQFMKTYVPSSCQVWVVPNGVDTEFFSFETSARSTRRNVIIFCGSMDVMMNIDAVTQFAKEAFPLIKSSVPDAEFWIVGRNPDPKVSRLTEQTGVKVTGSVKDVREYYREAKVAVAPFRYGAGTKLKILEAMAIGVPIVATDVGCQGIEAVPGEHVLIANDMRQFAECVINLLKDEKQRNRLAVSARLLVESKYSWSSIMRSAHLRLEEVVQSNMKWEKLKYS